MKFATTTIPCRFGILGGDNSSVMEFRAHQTYVVPDYYTQGIALEMRQLSGHVRFSGIGHYTRPYHGQDLHGKRLLAWRGCGIGDQLMWGGLLAAIKQRFPTCQITNLCAPNINHHLYAGAELPFTATPVPLPRAQWDAHDYHLIGEHLCETDREPDQPDVWTGMFRYAGLSDMLLAGYIPRPVSPLRQVDRLFAAEWLASHSTSSGPSASRAAGVPPLSGIRAIRGSSSPSRPHIVFQLSASSPIRTYDPWDTAHLLPLLVQTFFPTHDIVISATRRDREAFADALQTPGIIIADDLNIRPAMALVATAAALVCPDSCLGHLAAAENTPTISLWGSFLPEDRVGYYSNHHPLVGDPAHCDRAPCRAHEPGTPQGCPRCGEDPNACRYCAVLATITPEAIVDQVKEIL
jgi:hypothetical protein